MTMKTLLSKYFSFSELFVVSEGSISVAQFLAALALILISLCFCFRFSSVYLLDYVCYLPPDNLRVPYSHFIEHFVLCNFDQETIDFELKVLERSGIGVEACMPESVHEVPPDGSLKHAQAEIELVLFTIVKELLSKHNVHPKSIDILVSNCSLFCPTPSITSMIINKFGFRSNIKSVSLSGMGCSAGLLSISLAKDLLRVHKNSLALVLSMEAVAPNGYIGNAKSKLISNALFRMGGAAILLSNRKQDKRMAKYKLQHLVRTHMGSNDKAYESVYQEPDENEIVGVSLSRALLNVAASALRTNITDLGPLVLPYSEQIRYGWSVICRKIWLMGNKEIYVPNFRKAFEHFCIHAGGKSVIDAIEESLKLQKEDGEASRMALYRFGNTSSSSVWYELLYLEAKGRVKKGDRVWQIAFGSGFKCNSAVWKCLHDIDPNVRNAWSDRIHLYPVEIPVFDC
ncbi:3-ketoacyl-CoA synthase 7 [Gastrolobium bilobum]|uniref:3-ketoacyl-CoA synthase 7 n=1 Tax=Gastrolobium bilobum TaxID=150636 RepID=UPI002AAF5923|nr:3-ketoacyl-CoA synthase 7 [Gastrolobium bilobum]